LAAEEERVARLTARLEELAGQGPAAEVLSALDALHGVGAITAVGIVAEVGDLTRFGRPAELMAYAGLVPRERSSGGRTQRGAITKTGNAHLRHLLVEAAWHYVRPARAAAPARTEPERIAAIARTRLHRRFWRLVGRSKDRALAIVAVARELLGFVWAIAQAVARAQAAGPAVAA
jgi:transposase